MTPYEIDREIIRNRNARQFDYKLDTELECRQMIDSCLVYGTVQEFWDKYAGFYMEEIGKARLNTLVNEQVRDYKNAYDNLQYQQYKPGFGKVVG